METIYNQTNLGGVKDLYDSFYQKVEEAGKMGSLTANLWRLQHPWEADHRGEIFSRIKTLQKENEKLVVFSHSQGNLYANLACSKFGRDAFENIQIATPSSYIGCGEPTHYTSIKQDEMLYITGDVLRIPAALLADINPPLPPLISQNKAMTAGFDVHSINNYLEYSPARDDIGKHLKEVQDKLNLSIVKSKNYNISCDNVASYLWQDIRPSGENTSETISVLGIEQKFRFGDSFHITKTSENEYKIKTNIKGEWYPWILGTILTFLLFKNPQAIANLINGFGNLVQDQARRLRRDDDDEHKPPLA